MSGVNMNDDEVIEVIEHTRRKGVSLWTQDGELRYRAPRGALTRGDMARLAACRTRLAQLLGSEDCAPVGSSYIERCKETHFTPLTFTQMAYWNVHRLHDRHGIRHLASATRLIGRFDVRAFKQAVEYVAGRHDALRTHIVTLYGKPYQQIHDSAKIDFDLRDLSDWQESAREREVHRLLERLILEPVDLAQGPLWGVRLVRMNLDEHVLLLAMDHMISDAFSLNLLRQGLLTAYVPLSAGHMIRSAAEPMQFREYAIRQDRAHAAWLLKHGSYWSDHLRGCGRLRFPRAAGLKQRQHVGWGCVPLYISQQTKTRLQEWCRLQRTTLVLAVFTCFVGLVLRWCRADVGVVRYQTDGRTSAEAMSTIGYFASVLHVRVSFRADDTFVDLLVKVTRDLCNAYQHADASWLDAQDPQPAYAHNSAFNWVPLGSSSDAVKAEDAASPFIARPISFSNPVGRVYEKDSEPVLLLYDTEDGISGGVHFPVGSVSEESMQHFSRTFLEFLKALLESPDARVSDLKLPNDQ